MKVLVGALFVVAACANFVQYDWLNYVTTDSHYAEYMNSDGYHYNGYSYSTDKATYMNNDFCYAFYYDHFGCAGEPLVMKGALPGEPTEYYYGDGNSLHSASLLLYSDPAYDSLLGNGQYLNYPIGCVDMTYLDYDSALITDHITYASKMSSFDVYSMMFMCPSFTSTDPRLELPCARDCAGRACGALDGCGIPCVGSCSANNYCDTNGAEFECKPIHFGTFVANMHFEFPSFPHASSGPKRNYIEPTITHFENVLLQDIEVASDGLISRDSIVIRDYTFYGKAEGKLDVQLQFNVDNINVDNDAEYTVADIEDRLLSKVFQGNHGPFTQFLDCSPVCAVFGEQISGDLKAPSDAGTNDDEWESVNIHSSWLVWSESDVAASSTVTVCWTMLVAAVLALIAW